MVVQDRIGNHGFYLDRLIENLEQIGEDPSGIRWLCKDMMSRKPKMVNGVESNQPYQICDLVLYYLDRSVTIIELKGIGSGHRAQKAIRQLEATEELVRDMLGDVDIRKKLVFYNAATGGYTWQEVSAYGLTAGRNGSNP